MFFDVTLDNGCKTIIEIFERSGITAYAVGGCVRNSLMGIPVSDYDITVPCVPDKTKSILSAEGITTVDTGIKHGTVAAVVDGSLYEITTFRTESGYSDNRRPDSVSFVTDIRDDLSRRDFTVNAMAYNEKTGIIDLFGGREDIKAKLIRTVGDADTRFNEDSLRILRALRFSSVLDFDITANTASSIIKNAHLLCNVAGERVTVELEKMIKGKRFLTLLGDFTEVFCKIMPVFDKICEKRALADLVKILDKLPKTLAFFIAATLAVGYGKKYKKHAFDKSVLGDIKLTNIEKFAVLTMLLGLSEEIEYTKPCLKRLMYTYRPNHLKNVLTLRAALEQDGDYYQRCIELVDSIIENGEPYATRHLAVNGNDIKSLGYSGEQVGAMIQKALYLVIDGEAQNTKEDIIKKIAQPK